MNTRPRPVVASLCNVAGILAFLAGVLVIFVSLLYHPAISAPVGSGLASIVFGVLMCAVASIVENVARIADASERQIEEPKAPATPAAPMPGYTTQDLTEAERRLQDVARS
jgi:hypothetical protein